MYYYSFNYVYSSATNDLLNQQIENSKNQAILISKMLHERLNSGYSKNQVREEFQKSIENMSIENSFVCMFDSTGREICHPNEQKIGSILSENNSVIKSISNQKAEINFKKAIIEKKSTGGLRKMKKYTEIVYLNPVKNTNWIVASHANVEKFRTIFSNLKEKLSLIFILVWLSSSLLIYFFLQFMNSNNLKKIGEINRDTGKQYFNELKTISKTLDKKEEITKRVLADKGNQLTPVFINNIAFIFTENKITYIVEYNNEKSSINLTLDELFKSLNQNTFYRASRQIIVSVKAIDKIQKYGTTQLKVFTNPASPIDIIISKAKLTEFKKWAGKN
jgi:hypothetical protein